jgi:murein DD-endopeptidase MepM/ murein hydrolase activator NlpD
MWKTACVATLALASLALPTAKAFAQELETWDKLTTPGAMYTLEVTPYGVYAGEFTSNWGETPYNGVFVSHDLGDTWRQSGLEGLGITDIAYGNGSLYAASYYWSAEGPPGLYHSTDQGMSWTKLSPDFSAASVAVCANNILLGGYSHGLWVSQDGGGTWVQKLGDGMYGDDILSISVNGTTAITSDNRANYISTDCGVTWQALTSDVAGSLAGVSSVNNVWLACSATTGGIYRSVDYGVTYYPVEGWSPNPCYAITYYAGVFYAASHSNYTGYYTVVKSLDKGLTWQDITPNSPLTSYVHGLAWLAASPGCIFAVSPEAGVYRYRVSPLEPPAQPFLSKLWARRTMAAQTDVITSYFDHSYPFLAYPYKSEPPEDADTTTNFRGDRAKPPLLYYSSHDGIDFGLPYGTPILAPASGYAAYAYTAGGGYTIIIDHQNGYQTYYLHLQKTGLYVTAQDKDPKWVDKGQQVGLVGLTGTTTGPHLHFGVRHDKNANGSFLDDVPDGRVDPYAWQTDALEDPWAVYSWTDALGKHTGSPSLYLWEDLIEVTTGQLAQAGGTLTLENATVYIPENAISSEVTMTMEKTDSSKAQIAGTLLTYIHGTALLIRAYDNLATQVNQLAHTIELSYDLAQTDLSNVVAGTLKLMYFDPTSLVWRQVSTVWDSAQQHLTGFVTHLSEFAVFGDKADAKPPSTSLTLAGHKTGNWYTVPPTFTLSAQDGQGESGVANIFYSLDGGSSWEEYITQTQVVKNGVYAILYRASDQAQNYEDAKDSPLMRVDTLGALKDTASLTGSTFSTAGPL